MSEGTEFKFTKHSTFRSVFRQIAVSKPFTGFFACLTIYALFVPDLDLCFGDKDSLHTFSVLSCAVFLLFLVEIVVQSLGLSGYFARTFFWLDVIAMISIFPDTWFMTKLMEEFDSQAISPLVAGRSSRLTRLIRLVSRSSKLVRLQRLSRIIRLATMMPRLQAKLCPRTAHEDVKRIMLRKLRRVFSFLDEDQDGMVEREAVAASLVKMKLIKPKQKEKRSSAKDIFRSAVLKTKSQNIVAGLRGRARTEQPDVSKARSTIINQASASLSEGSKETDRKPARAATTKSVKSVKTVETRMEDDEMNADADEEDVFSDSGDEGATALLELLPWELPPLVSFDEYFSIVQECDNRSGQKVRHACAQFLSNSSDSWRFSDTDAITKKVALGSLLCLFCLSVVEYEPENMSLQIGLEKLDQMAKNAPNIWNGTSRPLLGGYVRAQTDIYRWGGARSDAFDILYLDANRQIICDFTKSGESACEDHRLSHWAGVREQPLVDLVQTMVASRRGLDLSSRTVPNKDDEPENEDVTSFVVVDIRKSIVEEGAISLTLTCSVCFVILGGISFLKRDITDLNKNLLQPLGTLADDMENMAQMQIAGFAATEASLQAHSAAVNEVRLIWNTFENMKTAIRSWGKYVPWPVVQILLYANVEAKLSVEERVISIFFSDIASFTTIVENLPPERSLTLLSRYFNDMSRVIDAHGGVVLEFIGDAISAIFGAPLESNNHASNAVKATLQMLGKLKKMNEWSEERGLPEVSIRCGVHTGKALVGNMGFHSRMKYGIVGEETHVPGMLEEANKNYGTNFLISENTRKELAQGSFVLRPVDYLRMPASGEEAERGELVHEVIARTRSTDQARAINAFCKSYANALNLYRSRDFDFAEPAFRHANARYLECFGSDDKACDVMMQRCRTLRERPPPKDWDGVYPDK